MAKSSEQAAADAGSAESSERDAASAGDLSPDQGSAAYSAAQKPAQQAAAPKAASGGYTPAPRPAASAPAYNNPAAANFSQLTRTGSSLAKDALIVGIGLCVGLYAVIEGPKLWKKVAGKKSGASAEKK